MICAPVFITVYDREIHFKRCIESLQRCLYAEYTPLYIASDSGRDERNQAKVDRIREFAQNINGFLSLEVIERKNNIGQKANTYSGYNYIFQQYDRVIVMEDDVIVGKYFLEFINNGLDKFFHNDRVVGICGYLPAEINEKVISPIFLKRRPSYGFGFWRHKEPTIRDFNNNSSQEIAKSVLSNSSLFKAVTGFIKPSNIATLPLMADGLMVAGDITSTINMNLKNKLALFPGKTITENTGNDGSGLNGGYFEDFNMESLDLDHRFDICDDIRIESNHSLDKLVVEKNTRFGSYFFSKCIFYGYNYIPCFPLFYFKAKKIKRAIFVFFLKRKKKTFV